MLYQPSYHAYVLVMPLMGSNIQCKRYLGIVVSASLYSFLVFQRLTRIMNQLFLQPIIPSVLYEYIVYVQPLRPEAESRLWFCGLQTQKLLIISLVVGRPTLPKSQWKTISFSSSLHSLNKQDSPKSSHSDRTTEPPRSSSPFFHSLDTNLGTRIRVPTSAIINVNCIIACVNWRLQAFHNVVLVCYSFNIPTSPLHSLRIWPVKLVPNRSSNSLHSLNALPQYSMSTIIAYINNWRLQAFHSHFFSPWEWSIHDNTTAWKLVDRNLKNNARTMLHQV